MSNVSHPSHYNSGRIEVIEMIEDKDLGFHLGNVVKYVMRAGKKDPNKEVEDLEKAEWYLKRKIELLKAEKEGRETIRPNDMVPRQPTSATDASSSNQDGPKADTAPSALKCRKFAPVHDSHSWGSVEGGVFCYDCQLYVL